MSEVLHDAIAGHSDAHTRAGPRSHRRGLQPPRPSVFGQVGFQFHTALDAKTFRTRLRAALDVLPLDALLAGIGGSADRWDTCVEETASRGIALYAWHPVLENTTDRYQDLESVGSDGQRAQWLAAHLPKPRVGFRFFCPNQPAVKQLVMESASHLIERAGVTGLFLDKIRYPSPASGLRTSLGCFCDRCSAAAREHGIDLSDVRTQLYETMSNQPSQASLRLLGFGDSDSDSDSSTGGPLLARWQRFRARSIVDIVREVATAARGAGLSVGLDLFAPALSGIVGQDYRRLSPLADWLKPMLYCRSWVPSAFPIEIDGIARALPIGARAAIAATLGHRIPSSRSLAADGLPQSLAAEQASLAQDLAGSVPSLAGIEVADRPGVCRMSPRHVARYAKLLRDSGAAGLVASPDILLASRENLSALARGLAGR